MKSVLVIDDCDDFRETLCDLLLDGEFDVFDVPCTDDAFQFLRREKVDLILCDLHMPFTLSKEHANYAYSFEVGIRTIQELCWAVPEIPVIGMSSAAPTDIRRIAKQLSGVPTLAKPFNRRELQSAIDLCVKTQRPGAAQH